MSLGTLDLFSDSVQQRLVGSVSPQRSVLSEVLRVRLWRDDSRRGQFLPYFDSSSHMGHFPCCEKREEGEGGGVVG